MRDDLDKYVTTFEQYTSIYLIFEFDREIHLIDMKQIKNKLK